MSKVLDAAKALVQMLEEKEKQDKVLLSALQAGETFKIGEHNFIVLEQDGAQTKVISKRFMAENVVFDDDTRDYGKSSLKELIENDIQQIIEADVGADNIIEHEVDLTSVDMHQEFEPVKCRVRPITFDEARKYNDLLITPEIDDWWWTCTPWSTKERGLGYSITGVSPSGYFDFNLYNDYGLGVRPFCILKSNIFVSKGE